MRRLLPLLAVFTVLYGCSVHRPMENAESSLTLPEPDHQEIPQTTESQWWMTFDDPVLTSLIETALTDNYTIRSAWSRLDQAARLAQISGASRFPGLNLGASGQRSRYETGTGPMGVDDSEAWQVTASISWQLDIWQKIAHTSRAAEYDYQASHWDLEATAQTIASSVADTWFALVAEREVLRLLSEQADVSRSYLDLVEYRFSNGLSSALEVYQQRSALAAVEAMVPESKASVQVLENTLNLLLGKEPGTPIPYQAETPDLPQHQIVTVSTDLLRNRPDVASAEMRLIAADHRLASAIADRLPALSLTYTAGTQATEFKDILDNWFTNIAGNLLAPVFDAGRLKAEAERNRAVVEERFLIWESALLMAWNEVENALARENGTIRSLDHLDGQVELATVTLERSRDQYLNGLIDYLNVLNSLQNLQQLQRARIRTRQSLLSNRVALHLASGGDWSKNLNRTHETDVQEKRTNQ